MKIVPLICELCALSDFDDVYLPRADGALTIRSGLKVCRGCRAVYAPKLPAPGINPPAKPRGPGERST